MGVLNLSFFVRYQNIRARTRDHIAMRNRNSQFDTYKASFFHNSLNE